MNDLSQYEGRQRLPEAAADAMMRVEIDIQISTAHAYPRSLTRVARNVTDLVSMSRQGAEECIYSLPRGGKPIVGPSIRLAEILFSQWGNCTGGSRTVEVNRKEGYVEAEGVFHDLETNAKTVRRTRRRITDKGGKVYNDDMIIVTANAAGSIAFRNAVLAGVPRAVWSEAYSKAEQVIKGDVETLPERRQKAFKAMAAFGLSADDVCLILDVEGHKDIGLEELVLIHGVHNSLKDGETDAEALLNEAKGRAADKIVKKIEKAEQKHEEESLSQRAQAKARPQAKKVEAEPEPKGEPEKNDSEGEAKPAEQKRADPEEEKPAETKQETKPEPARTNGKADQYSKMKEMILSDLDDSTPDDVDQVLELYGPQLDDMKVNAYDTWAELMDEIKQYREPREDS